MAQDCRDSSQIHIIPEGAANADALLGFIRLIDYLAQPSVLGRAPVNLIVDSGTGITATGDPSPADHVDKSCRSILMLLLSYYHVPMLTHNPWVPTAMRSFLSLPQVRCSNLDPRKA